LIRAARSVAQPFNNALVEHYTNVYSIGATPADAGPSLESAQCYGDPLS